MLIGSSIAMAVLCGLIYYANSYTAPTGKKYKYVHDGYSATVYVSHEVTAYTTGHIVGGNKIEGKSLAQACAIAMKVVDKTLRDHGRPGVPRQRGNVGDVIFYFLPNKAFNKAVVDDWPVDSKERRNPKELLAYTTRLERNIDRGRERRTGPRIVYFRLENMNTIVTKGGLAVHEMIHIIHGVLWGHVDKDHELWTDSKTFYKGRSLNRVCLENWLLEKKNASK